ncbi:MAG: hypothetical protein QJR12_09520 [Mycobacterium sp.]|uniref:hypothetical protein n=1 Tax=Mycobacterium sp. TaxID=1785 RepID=UPI002623A5D0|nr:hypothetical protein [Mycobacterium sp.]MDI3314499.1 hypothetical protein [Mycobacterium sp.]
MVDFTCTRCGARPEPLAESFAIVRHRPGCSVLAGVVRRRWPLRRDTSLPDTPKPTPFAQRADWGRFHRAVEAMQARRNDRMRARSR